MPTLIFIVGNMRINATIKENLNTIVHKIMETALKILSKAKHDLEVEKRGWLKQDDYDIADKINEEILDINIALTELMSIIKKKELKLNGIRKPWRKPAYSVIKY